MPIWFLYIYTILLYIRMSCYVIVRCLSIVPICMINIYIYIYIYLPMPWFSVNNVIKVVLL